METMRSNAELLLRENYQDVENKETMSFTEWVKNQSETEPRFFYWLFPSAENFTGDFGNGITEVQQNEFEEFILQIKTIDLLEKYIVVKMNFTNEDEIKMTLRNNFETVKYCESYADYGQKVGCYTAGCYSLSNSGSEALADLKKAIAEKFGVEDVTIVDCSNEFTVEPDAENIPEGLRIKIDEFIAKWREENESHTEATAWTYHDSHNFKTVVLNWEFGESDCEELGEDEQAKILLQYPGVPHIEGTNASEETEDFIYNFDRWATNPWICEIEIK